MRSVVIYASRRGNTRRLAEQIAATLRRRGSVELFDAGRAPRDLPASDLLVIGGPTEGRTMTEPMIAFLDGASASLAGRLAVAFDTRLAWPRMLSGSAAEAIAARLREAGARLAVAPESFIVSTKPELKPGELERAGRWADDLADAAGEPQPALASR